MLKVPSTKKVGNHGSEIFTDNFNVRELGMLLHLNWKYEVQGKNCTRISPSLLDILNAKVTSGRTQNSLLKEGQVTHPKRMGIEKGLG